MPEAGFEAFAGLVEEYRAGITGQLDGRRQEEVTLRQMDGLSRIWDEKFGGFPECAYRHGSLKGIRRRGVRDKYLKDIIVGVCGSVGDVQGTVIVNPVCVWGRHARGIATRLAMVKVIGTDIDPRFDRIYGGIVSRRRPVNYEFRQDNIFEPKVHISPLAVVFFGACGSLTDAAMDYAVESGSRFLICRTCCYENIGGNTMVVKQPTLLNRLFRLKNLMHERVSRKKPGFYFSPRYSQEAYPRSEAAREIIGWEEFAGVARRAVDSGICRAIIDLDRYLLLLQRGYSVWYKGELFFAERSGCV